MSIPRDGYYIAVVQDGTGGEAATHKLFCDLNTREEIIGFLQSGRAHETGIIASGVGESIAKHMAEMAQENKALREQMMLIQSAGQDAVDFIGGKHAMAGRVLDGWRKATQ